VIPTPRILLLALALAAALATATLLGGGPAAAAEQAPKAINGTLKTARAQVAPGRAVPFSARLDGAPATVRLQVVRPDGEVRGPFGPFAVRNGRLSGTLPAAATRGVKPGARTGYREVLGIYAVPADATGAKRATGPAAGRLAVEDAPADLVLESSFVSSVGWVKPGETFPFTVRVKNFQGARDGGTVTIAPPEGARFTSASAPGALRPDGTIAWAVGEVPAGAAGAPGAKALVVEARTRSLAQDPQIVWKNLSTTARLSNGATATTHGPKVIPQKETFDTARYGDRPFPVVPVDYYQRRHAPDNQADKLATKINDPNTVGSTFNLYQEMSYGQLFPSGTVPSDGIATADWSYEPGFGFTNTRPGQTCQTPTLNDAPGDAYQTLQPERIKDGWYQLPASTEYYGSDANGSALIGALTNQGSLQAIDSGCGPAGKAVYDAAQIADPEINYNDYDTDKDGVVDFFMMVFAGRGGNGDSQIPGEDGAYDNIWPHSSTLESSYTDPTTGQKGYISDDQLTDLEGRPLFWTDDSYTKKTTEPNERPVHVAVGPYNVNPETAIAKASVISHEYGHSLGLPDFYTLGDRGTYGDWNLMATDHSQNMDVFSRQELGWVVPRELEPGKETSVKGWKDSKVNTHRIDWKDPDGKPYTLTGPSVANGEAYVAKLPARQIIDPKTVPSGSHLYWSQSGNDFGCAPLKGHNIDIALPQLQEVPEGTKVTMTFKSSWDIEWDFDYGFVLGTADGGKTYESFPSAKGYSTNVTDPTEGNPNSSECLQTFDNGLTGTSQSYVDGSQAVDRKAGTFKAAPFVDDEYDLTALAGKASAVRFSYATDPGLARPGWFIDDVVIKAGDKEIYNSNFEQTDDNQIYNGGCREDLRTAQTCTRGWQYVAASEGSPADHAYYMEVRDRAGFDFDGHGEDDRADGPAFEPGLSLVYTDENHGYGNVGTDDPPAQNPLDSVPDDMTADTAAPDLNDAAWKATEGRDTFSDFGEGHVDNYSNPAEPDGKWRFAYDCLSFKVDSMAGDTPGPATSPGDITADVTFKMGALAAPFGAAKPPETDKDPDAPDPSDPAPKGCGGFDYGFTGDRGAPPEPITGNGSTTIAKPPGGGGDDKTGPVACKATAAFKGVSLKRRGRGKVRIAFTRRTELPVTVDVFRVSKGRSVIKERRVARFRNRTRSFTWNGKANVGGKRQKVGDGFYFVRYTMSQGSHRIGARRLVLRRRNGKFTRRPDFFRRDTCDLLVKFKLSRPVFGGRKKVALGAAYKLTSDARVTVTISQGGKVVKRYKAAKRAGGRTYRVKLAAGKRPRGDYKVRLKATSGAEKVNTVLTARKL
jgi:M6 family metalloprotease-like protein